MDLIIHTSSARKCACENHEIHSGKLFGSNNFCQNIVRNESLRRQFLNLRDLWAYLLPQNRLGLTTETLLLTVITSTTLGELWFLGLFVLSHLKLLVCIAGRAVSLPFLGNVHLKKSWKIMYQSKIASQDFWKNVKENVNKEWISMPKINYEP